MNGKRQLLVATCVVVAVAVLVLWWRVRGADAVVYHVRISNTSADTVVVDVSLPVASSADTVWVGGVLQDEAMGVHAVAAHDGDGAAREVTVRRRLRHHHADTFEFVELGVAATGAVRIDVSYRLCIGMPEGDPHTIGHSGIRYGERGRAWAVTSLAQLLLFPRAGSATDRVRIDYDLPDGWSVSAAVGGGQVSGGAENLREAVFAPMVLGRVRERAGPDGLRVVVADTLDARAGDAIVSAVARLYTDVADAFAFHVGDPYLVVVTEPDGDDFEAFIEETRYGCVTSARGGDPLHPDALVDAFTRRFVAAAGVAAYLTDPRDDWFGSGLAAWIGGRILRREGVTKRDDVRGAYAQVIEDGDSPLADPRGSRQPGRRAVKGRAVLDRLDAHLRAAGADSLAAIVPALNRIDGETTVQALLEGRLGVDLGDFFDRYVYGGEPLPFTRTPLASRRRTLTFDAGRLAVADSVALIVTYDGQSHLENCGCRVSQAGGISRLATWVRSYRGRFGGTCVTLSAGNSFPLDRKDIVLDEVRSRELRLYLSLMHDVGYDAAVVGETELMFGPERFRDYTRGSGLTFVSATVRVPGEPIAPAAVDVGGGTARVIGMTRPFEHVLFGRLWRTRNASVRFVDPVEAVGAALEDGTAGLTIVAGAVTPETARRIARSYDAVDVIVSDSPQCLCGDGTEAAYATDRSGFIGDALVLYPRLGTYGVSVFVLYRDARGAVVDFSESQVMVDEHVAYDPEIRARIDAFYAANADEFGSLSNADTGLWDGAQGAEDFVGAEACAECHAEQHDQWLHSAHAGAFKTLLGNHRQYSPRCVACHTTGFNRPSGYRFGDVDSPFRGVQCEACHGPGRAHVESGAPIERAPGRALCQRCHDPEHSEMTDGTFASYYDKVVH